MMQTSAPRQRQLTIGVSLAALLAAAPALGQALPTGGVVTAGAAGVQSAGGVLTVTQTTARADLNWQSFDIGAGGKVVFAQPSSSAVAVNRVLGGGPSAILGGLEANGRVFLLNPNGVVFGPGSQVNVGGLVAAAGELSGDPEGRFQITSAPGGTVDNAGAITVGGGVLLAGERVANAASGMIRGGGVTLAAGRQASVALDAGGLVRLQVDQRALDAAVANNGVIIAPGGQVLLTAKGVAAAVEVGGRVGTDGRNGSITVDAGPDGRVTLNGTLDARAAEGRGGEITVLGGDIGVGATARLDASGATGGGTILVGGGAHGQGQPYNARKVQVAEGASFATDAEVLGDGGTIVAWADGIADISGAFTARGGRGGGHGGFVETSGHDDLRIGDATTVNTLAPHGRAGDWLLDPTTITIAASGSATLGDAAGGASGSVTVAAGTISAATSNVVLSASTSITQDPGSNINIAASGVGITFQGLTAGSAPSAGTFLNGSITTSDGDITINGAVTLNGSTSLRTGTGSINITGAVDGGATLSLVSATGGAINLRSHLGGVTPLDSLYVTSSGPVNVSGSVFTQYVQEFAGGGLVTLADGVALVAEARAINFKSPVFAAGAKPVVLIAGYSGYTLSHPAITSEPTEGEGAEVGLYGGFTTSSRTPLSVAARGRTYITGDVGSADHPVGMMTFAGLALILGRADAPISIYGAEGLSSSTDQVGVFGDTTLTLAGGDPATGLGVSLPNPMLFVQGALAINAAHDVRLGIIGGNTEPVGDLTVSGYGGRIPTLSLDTIGMPDLTLPLNAFTANVPVSLGVVNTIGGQTYAMGGSFSGAYSSASGTISLTADRSAGRYITLAGATSFTGGAGVTLAGTVISPGGYGLSLSAPSLNLTQATLGDRTLGALGDLKLTSTGSVSFGSSAHAVSGTFSANVRGALNFRNSRAFSLGAISSAVTTARISSDSGDITITGAVSPSGDLTIIAGETGRRTLNGADDGLGNIRVSGGSVTLASGARGLFYTGSLSGSTDLAGATGLVGVGRSRYYIDTVNGYADATALPTGTGLHALFREQARVVLKPSLTDGVTTYDGRSHMGQFTISGLVMGDTVAAPAVTSITNGAGAIVSGVTAAGTYAFTPDETGLSGLRALGYAVSPSAAFTLDRAPLTITGAATSLVYNGAARTNTYSVSGLRGGDAVSGVSGLATGTNGGTYRDTLSGAYGPGLANYNISYVDGALTITGAARPQLTITGGTTVLTYNGRAQSNTFTVSGLTGGDTVTGVSGLAAGLNAGTYFDHLSNATGVGLANYDISYINGKLTIDPATLTLIYEANAVTSVYGQPLATLSGSVRGSGFVNGETLAALGGDAAWSTAAAPGSSVGAYAITGGGLTSGNYRIRAMQASGNATAYTLTRAPLTITGGTVSRGYTGQGQSNIFSITSGRLYPWDRIDGVVGLAAGVNAGTYADALSGVTGSGLDNYDIRFVNGRLTIDPAPLVLTYAANPAASVYGDPLAAVSGTAAASGLVGGDTLASLQGSVRWSTSAGHDAGSYAITGEGLSSANYAVEARQAPGNATAYTITQRPITAVSGISIRNKAYDGSLTATADIAGAVLEGLMPGDAVRLAPVTATFADSRPGVAIPVTVALSGLTGEAARNYLLAPATLAASAMISPPAPPSPATLHRPAMALRCATVAYDRRRMGLMRGGPDCSDTPDGEAAQDPATASILLLGSSEPTARTASRRIPR